MKKNERFPFGKIVILLLLVVSVLINIFQARKIDSLLAAEESTRDLPVGTIAPQIEVKEINGSPISLKFAESEIPTIIYVFTPQCVWCLRNQKNIIELSSKTRTKYRFIGISLTSEGLSEYLAKSGYDFPVYTEPSAVTKSDYKLGGTPKTMIISSNGKMVKNWNGAYMGDLKYEVDDFFDLELPGIETETKL